MPRIGIIGCGGMGRTHANAYSRIEGAELVGFADPYIERAEAFAETFGGKAYPSAEELIADARLDVVDICAITTAHPGAAAASLAARIPTIMEKPLARTLAEGKAIVKSFRDAGVPLLPGHVVRWFPEFLKTKAQIESGAIGTPAVVRITRGGPFPRGTDGWYGDAAQSGGVMLDMMIHDFDWLLWCFGEAERVTASSLMAQGAAVDKDYGLVLIRFKSGVIAHCEGTWAHTDGFRVSIEVSGDKGVLEWTSLFPNAFKLRQDAGSDSPAVAVPESPAIENPYFQEIRELLAAVTGGEPARVTPEDAVAALEICEACWLSARSGQPVTLPL